MAAIALGELPALPLHEAGKYVAAAYVVAFVLVLVYVTIMGIRMSRIERRLGELLEEESSPVGGELDVAREESARKESTLV
jgi:CcmD family protein